MVEAVSGEGDTGIPRKELEAYDGIRPEMERVGRNEEVFRMLRTRWAVKELLEGRGDRSEVQLDIEFEFENPIYAAMSSAAAEGVAGVMVEAFEKRAREVLGRGNV